MKLQLVKPNDIWQADCFSYHFDSLGKTFIEYNNFLTFSGAHHSWSSNMKYFYCLAKSRGLKFLSNNI